MNSYKVTSTEWGKTYEQWYSTKAEALRFAKGVTRRGFEPAVIEYRNNDYSKGRYIGKASILNSLFWRGW